MLRSVLAVFVGYVVMVLCVVPLFAFSGMSPDQIPSTNFLLLALGVGMVAAVLGGYVAGFIAGRTPFKHGVALAVVIGVLWVISFACSHWLAPTPPPLLYDVANLGVGVAGSLLGSWLRELQTARRSIA